MSGSVGLLASLLGRWAGSGSGRYPSIAPFRYHEEVTFTRLGPVLVEYHQRTRHAITGEPLHTEHGYLRAHEGGTVELTIAQPTGIVEVHAGRWSPGRVHLRSTLVAGTPSAKPVQAVERILDVEGDRIHYVLLMTAVGHGHQVHLEARLERTPPPSAGAG